MLATLWLLHQHLWHIGSWRVPMESAYRQAPNGRSFFWCLTSPIVEGIRPLPPWIERDWPLAYQRLRPELNWLIRNTGADRHSPEQMAAAIHLIYYGTPIAINPYLVSRSTLAAADQRLRAKTGGRCTFTPPAGKVPPTSYFT